MKSFKYTCSTDLEDEITATCIDELALLGKRSHSDANEVIQANSILQSLKHAVGVSCGDAFVRY